MTFPYQRVTPKVIRPIIPVILRSKEKFIFYPALVDSGSDYCIFSIEIAEILGIKLSKKARFKGIGKENLIGFWGETEINIGRITYKLDAIFAEISDFGHGILGQKGFFDHFDVKLSYKKKTIEITPLENLSSEPLLRN